MLRLYLAGGAIAALLAGLWYVQHLRGEVSEARAEAAAQARQAELNANATESLDRHAVEVRVIERTVKEAQDAVRQAPGASDDFAVRDELCRALAGMRDGEPACEPDSPPDVP